MYDFTMPLEMTMKAYPGDSALIIEELANFESDGHRKKGISFNTHTGTHIDAPAHMIESGKTLDMFLVEKFIGEVVVIDAREMSSIDCDLSMINEGDFVFFCTGHTAKMAQVDYFENGPVISEELAQKLVLKKVSIIGLDSFSPDNSPYPVHKILLPHDILIVENLMNLEQAIGKRLQCTIMPLLIKDADGAPCRVIAQLKPNH